MIGAKFMLDDLKGADDDLGTSSLWLNQSSRAMVQDPFSSVDSRSDQ